MVAEASHLEFMWYGRIKMLWESGDPTKLRASGHRPKIDICGNQTPGKQMYIDFEERIV